MEIWFKENMPKLANFNKKTEPIKNAKSYKLPDFDVVPNISKGHITSPKVFVPKGTQNNK